MKNNEETRIDWVIEKLKHIPNGGTILDVGSGPQPFKKHCSHLHYVSQDFSQYSPEENPSGLHLENWQYSKQDIISDILSIPREDSSFDAILCTEVFEHIPSPIDAIKELSRLLKPNGFLILTAPFCSMTHFAPYFYYSGFSRYFYETHLAENNFEIMELSPNGNYFRYVMQETARFNGMAEKYCGKKLSWLENIIFRITYKIIAKYEQKDLHSSETLCFGLHLLCRKKES
jgi:ubiquinone/menaquinone biosynthesis C-methylase UbiE